MDHSNTTRSTREETIVRAKNIVTVLGKTPMTAAEINKALNEDYTALQISNAIKMISGASATKVSRVVRNTKGFQVEKQYAAYYLEGTGVVQELRRSTRPQGMSGSQSGGVSERKPSNSKAEYQGKARAIASVLSHTPMTVLEINAALYSNYTALQVANAVKFIPHAGTCKVRRIATNSRGEKVEREYTAYFLE